MHEDLSTTWRTELRAGALAALPEEKRRFLMPRVTARDLLLVPDAEPQRADVERLLPHKRAALRPVPADVLGLPPDAGERDPALGSNNWVVAGSRTRSGKPLLANDPHMAMRAPGIWYALRIELGDRFVQGVALPGVPGIVIGQND